MSELTAKQEQAAVLVAEAEMSNDEIAAACGIAYRTLNRWKLDPDFAAAVADHITRLGQELSRYAIARKDKRVAALNDRWQRLQLIADEWAEHGLTDRHGNPVPGSSTGYQRQQATATKAGMIYEYAADTGLSAELRALEKQAAQEVGQWSEKSEVTGKDGGPIPHHHTLEMGGFSNDELRSIVERATGRGTAGTGTP